MKNKGCWTTILIACVCLWLIGSCFGNDEDGSSYQTEQVDSRSSESNLYGPDWLHKNSFAGDLEPRGKMVIRFNSDGSFTTRLTDGGFDKFSAEGTYTVSGNHVSGRLNNGTELIFTLDEENHRVDTSTGFELKQTVL